MSRDQEPKSSLNPFQQNSLRVGCAYIDQLLSDIEQVLNVSQTKSVFPKYINDITPVQRKTIEDYIGRIRAQLLRVLAGEAIPVERPKIAASHAINTALTFVDINIEELSPKKMRGYGELSPMAVADLNGVMQELESIVQQMQRYVLQKGAPDLEERLRGLDSQGSDVELLRKIEEIVTRRGLVEYRSTLLMLLERLEDTAFEIAIFGRVSSGKSSLLNHIIGADLLPVGVTPITAVPTRVSFGEKPEVIVRIEGFGIEHFELSRLAEFVDERNNPGNQKRVARVSVHYPSERLHQGIIFVDTPGLGSLATSGAVETMAYLPRCDLGVVLIDAGSTLTPQDLSTIETLSLAKIPVTVVLSKADLLKEKDRESVREYIRSHVRSELGVEVDVRPVSTLPSHAELLESWFEQDISSLYAHQKELRQQSILRKSLSLRDAVLAGLQCELQSDAGEVLSNEQIREVEVRLRRAGGILQSKEPEIRSIVEQVPGLRNSIVRKAATEAVEMWSKQDQVDLGELLVNMAMRVMVETAGKIRELLSSTAIALSTESFAAAKFLPNATVPQEDFFHDREMPVFHMNREELKSLKPKLGALLGERGMVRYAESRMECLVPALEIALNSYSIILMGWAERALAAIGREFNLYADQYRAQLERLGNGNTKTTVDRKELEADIEVLSAFGKHPAESHIGA
jgi:GTPase Era involved in 16S rRNA processing